MNKLFQLKVRMCMWLNIHESEAEEATVGQLWSLMNSNQRIDFSRYAGEIFVLVISELEERGK